MNVEKQGTTKILFDRHGRALGSLSDDSDTEMEDNAVAVREDASETEGYFYLLF